MSTDRLRDRHAAVFDLEPALDTDVVTVREAELGEMQLSVETYHETFDTAAITKGLPDDRCQCPHWGYVLDGEAVVRWTDGEETIQAGEAYYLGPAHNATMTAGTRLVNFSPRDDYREMMAVMARNLERSDVNPK